jgi:hypothetical protein
VADYRGRIDRGPGECRVTRDERLPDPAGERNGQKEFPFPDPARYPEEIDGSKGVLSPAELLVGAGKVLGGKRPEERELAGKDTGCDDLSQFLGIGSRGTAAACHPEQF